MTETTKRSTKTYKQVSYEVFKNTADKLELNGAQLAEALGYSPSAWAKWEASKKLPAVAGLACEALIRRRGNSAKGDISYQLLKTFFNGTVVISEFVPLDGPMQDMNINGVDYILLKVK